MANVKMWVELIARVALPLILAIHGAQLANVQQPGGVKPLPPPVVVESPPMPVPPPPFVEVSPMPVPPPPVTVADPAGATVKIRVGNDRCTATILQDRPSGGGYFLLSAAHCVSGGREGSVVTNDGRTFRFRVCCVDRHADIALSVFQAPEGLPFAVIAASDPTAGTAVWHQGYGIDKPGNKETGKVGNAKLSNGQLSFVLSVSPGDSGSGIFRQDNGELIGVVSSAGGGKTYGGSALAVRKLLASSTCR